MYNGFVIISSEINKTFRSKVHLRLRSGSLSAIALFQKVHLRLRIFCLFALTELTLFMHVLHVLHVLHVFRVFHIHIFPTEYFYISTRPSVQPSARPLKFALTKTFRNVLGSGGHHTPPQEPPASHVEILALRVAIVNCDWITTCGHMHYDNWRG